MKTVPAVRGRRFRWGSWVVGMGNRGVVGQSETFQGVFGKSRDDAEVVFESAAICNLTVNCLTVDNLRGSHRGRRAMRYRVRSAILFLALAALAACPDSSRLAES